MGRSEALLWSGAVAPPAKGPPVTLEPAHLPRTVPSGPPFPVSVSSLPALTHRHRNNNESYNR